MYPAGISSCVYSEQAKVRLFADSSDAFHPAYVGKHIDTYSCHSGTVRFLPCTVGRGGIDFRYV